MYEELHFLVYMSSINHCYCYCYCYYLYIYIYPMIGTIWRKFLTSYKAIIEFYKFAEIKLGPQWWPYFDNTPVFPIVSAKIFWYIYTNLHSASGASVIFITLLGNYFSSHFCIHVCSCKGKDICIRCTRCWASSARGRENRIQTDTGCDTDVHYIADTGMRVSASGSVCVQNCVY